MTLTILVTLVIALVVVFAAVTGFQSLRGRRHAQDGPGEPLTLSRALDAVRDRAAHPAAVTRQRAPASDHRLTRPDLQPARTLALPGSGTLEDDWPLGLAVAAISAGPVGAPRQDVYYVQRNLIALARGLTGLGAGQRAAALTLSAVMTSKLGQAPDVEQALREGASAANRLVRSVSQRDPQYSDMVTTLDVVYAAFDARKPQLHYVHVGSSTIWLQRAGSPAVEQLTERHVIPDGPVLRAVGLAKEIAPDTGREPVEMGDRIFLTAASPSFAFTESLMNAAAGYLADRPLHDALAALAETVHKLGISDEVTIVGAEVARPGTFLT